MYYTYYKELVLLDWDFIEGLGAWAAKMFSENCGKIPKYVLYTKLDLNTKSQIIFKIVIFEEKINKILLIYAKPQPQSQS